VQHAGISYVDRAENISLRMRRGIIKDLPAISVVCNMIERKSDLSDFVHCISSDTGSLNENLNLNVYFLVEVLALFVIRSAISSNVTFCFDDHIYSLYSDKPSNSRVRAELPTRTIA